MKKLAPILAFTLATACNEYAEDPRPQSSPVQTPDGSGGGTEQDPEENYSDLELIQENQRDIYSSVIADVLLGTEDQNSWEVQPGEELTTVVAELSGNDLYLATLFRVTQDPECDVNTRWGVVTGLVEDCDFTDVEAVRYPLEVAAPFSVDSYGDETYYTETAFDNSADECDSDGERVGFIAVPFSYEREGDSIEGLRAIPTTLLGCLKEGGELDWAEPLASTAEGSRGAEILSDLRQQLAAETVGSDL